MADVTEPQAEIVPGNHVAGRAAGALVLVAHREPGRVTVRSAAYQALLTLLGKARQAAEQQPGNPGRLLARLAAEWADGTGAGAGSEFVIVSRADGRLALFGRGAISVVLVGTARAPEGTEVLRGSLDQVVRVPAKAVAIFIDDAKGRVPGLPPQRGIGSLAEGIAPAGGAVLWCAGLAEPAIATQLMPSVNADTPPTAVGAVPPSRVAQTARAEVVAAPASQSVKIMGFRCARRHLSDPRAAFCTVCGMPVDQTQQQSEGDRPALGKLILDDGSVYPLDTDYVFGRAPDSAAAPGPRQVKLEDPYGGMSRAHLEVRLSGWDVAVRDLRATNGTLIRSPGSAEWLALPPGVAVPLLPGGEVMLANRILRYETASLRI